MLERLVAPWPQERFAPTLSVSVPAPSGAPDPEPQAKRRALDCIDAWLDRALRLPMVLSLNPETFFELDLAHLFRRTHTMIDGGVETTLRFQETFLPHGVFADLDPRLARAFDSLWTPRALAFAVGTVDPVRAAALRAHLRTHHHASSLRAVLNRIAALANDELHRRVREGWDAGTAAAQDAMAPSANDVRPGC